jgi:hypothetical protein
MAVEEFNAQIVIFSGPGEAEIVDNVAREM